MKQKRGISRTNNIFDVYAGTTIGERGFQPPEGIQLFKSIGLIKADGTWELHPTLAPKAKAAPPLSPKTMNRFPPGTDPNDARGIISPTSPHQNEPMNWPLVKRQRVSVRVVGRTRSPARSKTYESEMVVCYPQPTHVPRVIGTSQRRRARGRRARVQGVVCRRLTCLARPALVPRDPSRLVLKISNSTPTVPLTPAITHGPLDGLTRLQSALLPTFAMVLMTGYNIHGPDGYVRVAVFIQLPEMRDLSIDQRVIELVFKSNNPRIMTNASGDRIRAIQGHTLEQFNISELYDEINILEDYINHPKWARRGVPDHLVLEISNENHFVQWKRLGTFLPSQRSKFHTMREVCGIVKQEFGAKNVIFYAFLSVEALFEHVPKIDIYITDYGRIVTNNVMAAEILNPMQVPPPSALAGSQRVRSRDAMGGSPAPMGSNYTELPVPDRKIITKNTLELKSGHMNMLSRMAKGTPWQQHRQLQMLKGMYKTTMCKHESRGCAKGADCVFAHTTDNEAKIDAEVIPLRFDVYTKLYEDRFSLPSEILYEIGQTSKEEYQIAMRKKAHHQDLVDEQAAREAAARTQRPRVHDNSRSPRSVPGDRDSRTPDPNRRGSPET